jgi:hypothetical protein
MLYNVIVYASNRPWCKAINQAVMPSYRLPKGPICEILASINPSLK